MPDSLVSINRGDRVASADYRDALPVNLYSVIKNIKDSQGYMINHPGVELFATASGVDRGGFYSDRFNAHFRVSANDFISVSTDGTITNISQQSGVSITGSLDVRFAQSFNNLCIVSDNKVWYYNPTNGLRRIDSNDPNDPFGNPIDVIFTNGVFLFTDGEELYHTSFSNEEMIPADAVATAEFLPDGIAGLERQRDNLIVVFGRFSTEYFTPDSTETFAFRRQPGLATKVGIVNAFAKTELDGQFFVIGGRDYESTSIHVVTSGGIQTIATREIEKILATYPRDELVNSSMETRVEDGDKFIYVQLPNQTLLYNHTVAQSSGVANAWSLLKTSITTDDAWNGRHFVFDTRISRWICGERFGNRIGRLNNTISTLYGENIEWIFFTPFLPLDGQSIDEIEIKTISGFTSNPDNRVTISLTYDGEVYQTERPVVYGSMNERDRRFIARRFGYVRNQVSLKVRGVVQSRVAFGAMRVTHG